MNTTPGMTPGMTPGSEPPLEERLRAALSARADLVRAEDLRHAAPVWELRPRWQSPWALLAVAAAVLLVLGVVLTGLDRNPRSDDVAPRPDEPGLVLPPDVGRDWKADDISSPARLDLDGDGVDEKVKFLGEPTKDFDGRTRLQTTLSTTGEEAYGIAELGTTIGTNALDPIDADSDGDQELVLYYEDMTEVGGGGYPLVFDLRGGLLVQAVVEDPELLVQGEKAVPGSETEFYDMVLSHTYWIEDGRLYSARSVDAFARGNMTLLRPEFYRVDTYAWRLDEDGLLVAGDTGCRTMSPEGIQPCESELDDGIVHYVDSAATGTFGVGEGADFNVGYRFGARVEAGVPPVLVVEGDDGRALTHELDVPDPRVSTEQPTGIFSDGASLLVTSASDPSVLQVLVQDGDDLRPLQPVGEVASPGIGGDARSWLTRNGSLVTVLAVEGDTWQAWTWMMVSRTEMSALPWGEVCFDDVDDPSTARQC